jgi:hypothetical protein
MRRHSTTDAIRLNDPHTVLCALDDLLPQLRERTTEAELLRRLPYVTVADLAEAGFKDGRPVGFSSFLMPLGGYQIRDEWHGGRASRHRCCLPDAMGHNICHQDLHSRRRHGLRRPRRSR